MDKYEELYNHAKYAYEEEAVRFSRLEDKAGKFITIVSSLLAVYALTGRELFDSLFPIVNTVDYLKVTFASFVLLSLVVSWGFSFRAFQLQGTRKVPLNEEILDFFKQNNLVTIQYAMTKRYSESRNYNKKINDWKARNLKWCFQSTIAVVVSFILFISVVAVDAYNSNKSHKKDFGTCNSIVIKEIKVCSSNEQSNLETTNQSHNNAENEPDFDVVAPEFEISTESFDPTVVPETNTDNNQ